jgi:2-haloacid dehalogenase
MSEKQPITGIKACVFDAYGTLFDVHSAVGKHRHRLGDIADQVSNLWRTKQLEYDALDFAFDMHNLEDPELQSDLIEAYFHLDCYPEVPQALSMLKARGFRIAILSNGTPAMLEAAVRNSGLEELIEKNFSVEEVGVFKPDPRVYQIAVDGLNVTPDEIVFQSSNAWDVSGAATFGLRVCWINRFAQKAERLPGQPDVEIKSLIELPDLLL